MGCRLVSVSRQLILRPVANQEHVQKSTLCFCAGSFVLARLLPAFTTIEGGRA
jgi:hypothetical protein